MRLPCRRLVTGAALPAATLAPAKTLVHAGSLIDGRADTLRKHVTITVDGDRITGIADGYIAPATGDTVYAKRTLLAGFTTVRDCGASDKLNLALRDAIAKGWVDGPRAYAAGVKIAFGPDQGVAPHGDNAKEFIYMVEAGMPPMKAIQSATLEAAKLVDAEKDLGSVESGKIADLVAVPGDPPRRHQAHDERHLRHESRHDLQAVVSSPRRGAVLLRPDWFTRRLRCP